MSIDANRYRRESLDSKFDDVFHALARNADGLTAHEIVLETHRSKTQTRHILNELIEQGRVRRFRDPDDQRIYRYVIDVGDLD